MSSDWTDVEGYTCSEWYGWDCEGDAAGEGYSAEEIEDLLAHCCASCGGTSAPTPTMTDKPTEMIATMMPTMIEVLTDMPTEAVKTMMPTMAEVFTDMPTEAIETMMPTMMTTMMPTESPTMIEVTEMPTEAVETMMPTMAEIFTDMPTEAVKTMMPTMAEIFTEMPTEAIETTTQIIDETVNPADGIDEGTGVDVVDESKFFCEEASDCPLMSNDQYCGYDCVENKCLMWCYQDPDPGVTTTSPTAGEVVTEMPTEAVETMMPTMVEVITEVPTDNDNFEVSAIVSPDYVIILPGVAYDNPELKCLTNWQAYGGGNDENSNSYELSDKLDTVGLGCSRQLDYEGGIDGTYWCCLDDICEGEEHGSDWAYCTKPNFANQNEECKNTPGFFDGDGVAGEDSSCHDWFGYNCAEPELEWGYSESEVDDILANCCAACSYPWMTQTVAPAPVNTPDEQTEQSCENTVGFVDEGRNLCEAWEEHDCNLATSKYMFTVEGAEAVRENCCASCAVNATEVNGFPATDEDTAATDTDAVFVVPGYAVDDSGKTCLTKFDARTDTVGLGCNVHPEDTLSDGSLWCCLTELCEGRFFGRMSCMPGYPPSDNDAADNNNNDFVTSALVTSDRPTVDPPPVPEERPTVVPTVVVPTVTPVDPENSPERDIAGFVGIVPGYSNTNVRQRCLTKWDSDGGGHLVNFDVYTLDQDTNGLGCGVHPDDLMSDGNLWCCLDDLCGGQEGEGWISCMPGYPPNRASMTAGGATDNGTIKDNCEDDFNWTDELGNTCHDWFNYNCDAAGAWGYSDEGVEDILKNCCKSCSWQSPSLNPSL
ncbi:hypothetical protein TrVE_jg10514 [Triparma verrucosa]|nr:hypothetical protein TrVE_jg10514 [Triparma verrucosa]